MATISAYIALRDGMTGPLKSIIHANNTLINAMLSTQNASRHMLDTASLRAARAQLAGAESGIQRMEEEIARSNQRQQQLNNSFRAGNSASNALVNNVKRLAATYLSFQAGRGILGLSDQMAGAQARLSLIVDDGGSVAALERQIFESAQRSRASYMSTMQSVSKFGLLAGKAFSNNNEIIRFAELMNKNFIIAGASASEQTNAMYQLNQAMGSGRLQGDEYRSIIENAPLLARSIEDYMRNVQGVTGSMKDWSSEGLLTADVIKNALFSSAAEVEARFNSMPMTFGQIWTNIASQVIMKFRPILEELNKMANGNNFQQVVAGTINALSMLAGAAVKVFGIVGRVAGGIVENWAAIKSIVLGAATAMIIYKTAAIGVATATAILSAQEAVRTTIQGYLAIRVAAANAAQAGATVATFAQTVARYGLNAALMACPIFWIIGAIILVITVIYAAVAAFNKFAGTSYSATGLICGAVAVAAAFIANTLIGLFNGLIQLLWTIFVDPFIGIVEWVLNVANGGFDSFGMAVSNLIGQIISWFLSLGKVVTKIIDAIFGTNWTDGLSALQKKIVSWDRNENAITLNRDAPIVDRLNYGGAWSAGYGFGENLFAKDHGMKAGKGSDDILNGIGASAALVADNTGKTAKNTSISGEDLKYLRDIAERDVINRFTTAELSITMQTTASINSDLDIDGVISKLEDKTYEAMLAAVEGV